MRIEQLPKLPPGPNAWAIQLVQALQLHLGRVARQLNLSSEGFISGATNASASAPTTGTYVQGDFVRNSTPSEAGSAGSKYVTHGWQCVASGTPGTWKECRFLTGD